MVEHDLFDFLLLSLPDNDWHSHRAGPEGQVHSIGLADEQLTRVMDAGGGLERFLQEHAMIVMADHSQAPIDKGVALADAFSELGVLAAGSRGGNRATRRGSGPEGESTATVHARNASRSESSRSDRAQIAVCPSQRAAMVYVLDEEERERLRPKVLKRALQIDGVELVMWLERDAHGSATEAAIASPGGSELRFSPDGDLEDPGGGAWSVEGGRAWSVEGSVEPLRAEAHSGCFIAPDHPKILERVWSALNCSTSGDVLLSASPGHEFADLGGQAHVGGGSHGSLRGEDSLGALILCGVHIPHVPEQWSIRDIAALVGNHFAPEVR
jgi:hypothetical protein